MRKFLLLIMLISIDIFYLKAQEKISTDKPLPIVAWAGIPAEETNIERFKELKEMGINLNLSNYLNTDAMEQALDLAQKVGIRMVTSCPELKTDPEKTVKHFMNHPALAGYFLRDEPIQKDFEELGKWAKRIESIDNKHFCFVNLISSIHPTKTEALGTPSYAEYVRNFANTVPSKVLSFDFYPVLTQGIHQFWYEGLGIFSTEAAKLNMPFWGFALASSYNELHPVPNMAALRLQLYSNLAYGAQGLEYWAYWMSDGLRCAPIGMDGKRTVIYDLIKAVNKEIQDVSGVFSGAKVISVGHTGVVIPRGTARLGALPDAIKVFETEGEGALVSILENGANTYFLIVNRDLENKMQMTILGGENLRRVLKDGSVVKASTYSNTLEIEPGDVAIYSYPTKNQSK